MPETLQIRSDHGCCSLPEDNPYENFKKFKTMIKDYQGNFNHDWDKRQILKNSLKKQDQKDEYVDDAYIVNHSKVEVLQKGNNIYIRTALEQLRPKVLFSFGTLNSFLYGVQCMLLCPS